MAQGDGSGNGHLAYATAAEVARLDRRLDEQAEVHQRRAGDLETAEIRLEAKFGQVLANIAALNTDVNNGRLNATLRFDRLEKLIEAIAATVGAL